MASVTPRARIWVTRTQPDAAETAARLDEQGFAPIVAPVLVLEPIAAAIDLAGVSGLVFTSRNGVRLAGALPRGGELPVFTVGDRTAEAARAAGYRHIQSAGGDVGALARLILATHGARQAPLLHLGAQIPAGDLAGALRAGGVAFRSQALYRTRWVPLRRLALDLRPWTRIDGVLVHSPKAARRLAALPGLPKGMTAICISEAAREPLAPLRWRALVVSREPTEASLMRALQDHFARR